MRVLLAGLAALTLTGAAAAAPAWVEITAAGAQARLVSRSMSCPAITIDGHRHRMIRRVGPQAGFAGAVCQAELPATVRSVRIARRKLPIPARRPRRLVIFGDSGCRLNGWMTQHCNDPSGWPFARVAALAAARRPDLVIHVGDYYYREKPCPAGEAACAGSPWGDTWATWKAELFKPAAPLLAAAPWVFVRGNHESCERGGAGWFRLLDAAALAKPCPAEADTFAVDLAGVRLLIVDSADTEDHRAPPDKVADFARRLIPLGQTGGPVWILTHRPVWFAVRHGDTLTDGETSATERAAVKGADLSGVDLILSGHVHDFTALDFAGARPAQLIVGTGGDVLDRGDIPPPATGAPLVEGKVATAFSMGRFGYFLLDRQGDDWVGGFHDLTDALVARCRLHGRSLRCETPDRTLRPTGPGPG